MRFFNIENAFWNKAESFMVLNISLKRLIGIINANSFSGISGRADGSSMPRKDYCLSDTNNQAFWHFPDFSNSAVTISECNG